MTLFEVEVIKMNRDNYVDRVEKLLDVIVAIECNPTVIPRVQVCRSWHGVNTNLPTVPGYWMSDAMEDWGKRNSYTLVWSTTKRGKRRNVMLVKYQ